MSNVYVIQCLEYGDLDVFSSAQKAVKSVKDSGYVDILDHQLYFRERELIEKGYISFDLKERESEVVTIRRFTI